MNIQNEITLENVEERLRSLESEPYIDRSEIVTYTQFSKKHTYTQSFEKVPVSKIISAHALKNWGDIRDYKRPNEYIIEMIKAIKSGNLDLEKNPPILNEFGGAYAVSSDGITRCGVAKLMGLKIIPAQVTYHPNFDTFFTRKKDDYEILLERKETGLWQGNINVYRSKYLHRFQYALGQITDYEGIWVFARDMLKVKNIYKLVGAKGKE